MRLSVLDFFPSLPETLALAPAVEQLGYHRFWIAEHQPQPNPLLVTALVASRTRQIRVGPAGILFPFYSPTKTAYDFQLLEAAYPGRIDAGFCAGWAAPSQLPGLLDGRPAARDPVTYQQRVATFVQTLRTTSLDHSAQTDDLVWPGAPAQPPEIWVHGTGQGSVATALHQRIRLGFSLFHAQSVADPTFVRDYRTRFCRCDSALTPRVALAVAGVCAATPARVEQIMANRKFSKLQVFCAGTPLQWRAALHRLWVEYAPDDIVILDLCRHYEDRLTSYTLLAEAVGLE